jgi:hypothetical protein
MELITEAELYVPSIDNIGKYIDIIPPIRNGIRCSCSSRTDKIYGTKTIFSSHVKTKMHQKWLETLNTNRSNYYAESIKQKELIENQRNIIQKQAIELQVKDVTIDYLTKQLTEKNTISDKINLIDL